MDTIGDLKARLRPLFKQYQIRKAILFGSLARGEATRRSDIDLILIQETKKRFWDRYDGILLDLDKQFQDARLTSSYTPPKSWSKLKTVYSSARP
jgi:predicted nucleotidyltransferase